MKEPKNLMSGLLEEISRNRELQQMYAEIGTAGIFGLNILRQKIAYAERAIASGDITEMISAYTQLQESK